MSTDAPTQELPPWLSYSATTYTDAAGAPITTSSLVYLPLTYYGPSIPLDTLFTYGGPTSPEFTSTPKTAPPAITESKVDTLASAPSPAIPIPTPATPPPTLTTSSLPAPPFTIFPTPPSSPGAPTATAVPSVSPVPSISIFGSSTVTFPLTMMSTIMSLSISPSTASSLTTPSISSSPSTLLPSSTASTALSSTASMRSSLSLTPTPSSTISASALPGPVSNASRNAIVAIVLGAILGSVFLLLLILLCLRWRVRRNRDNPSEFAFETPVWADWMIVNAARNGFRRLRRQAPPRDEGSPRHSGEEIDPFLTHRASARPEFDEHDPEAGPSVRMVRPDSPIGLALRRGPGSDEDEDSIGSGYGNLLDRFPSASAVIGGPYGHIMQPEDLLKLDNEPSSSAPRSHSPLPPPRRPEPDRERVVGLGLFPPTAMQKPSDRSLASEMTDAGETGTLHTARRVRVREMGIRPSTLTSTAPPPGPSSSRGFGAALTGLRRLSWLKAPESSSRPTSYFAQPLTDQEIEAGRALLGAESREIGAGPEGLRPISGVSARSASAVSGASLYYDAPSSLPGSPRLTPPPPALTPSGIHHGSHHQSRPSSGLGFPIEPLTYDPEPHIMDSHSPTQTNLNLLHPPEIDILDIPAPPPASPFGSASPWGSSASSRGSMPLLQFPPGLAFLTAPRPWQDLSESSESHRASGTSDHISIDVLEEEPPAPADPWRSLTGVFEGLRRSTFGTPHVVHQNDPAPSQQGSLHSMRQQLSARSSTASALRAQAASEGSASSRPSVHSGLRSMGSGHSQASMMVGSSRWLRDAGGSSPAVSAFGPIVRPAYEHGYWSPYPSPPRSPITLRPSSHPVAGPSTVRRRVSSAPEEPGSPESPGTGISSVPWAGGLDSDWNAR